MATETAEQKSDVTDTATPGADVAADTSSDTAIADQLAREDSERTPSPDNPPTDVAGEHQETGKEAEEVETKAPDTDKQQIKSRTAKRFAEREETIRAQKAELGQLKTEKQLAEEKAKALEEENKAFRARSLQQIEQAPLAAADASPPSRTDAGQVAPKVPPPESIEAEVSALQTQYWKAKDAGDEVQATLILQQYHHKNKQLEEVKRHADREAVIREVEQRKSQKEQQRRFLNKLHDVHERHPLFVRDKASGQLTQNLDFQSPIMVRAGQIALREGMSGNEFLGNITEYLAKAELEMVRADRATDSAMLTRARTHAGQLAEKAGLETGSRSVAQENNSKSLEGLSDEELNDAVSRQVRGR